jgi:CHRD domain
MGSVRVSSRLVFCGVVLIAALGFGGSASAGSAAAADGGVRLRADLDGAQEVPPADPDGRGAAQVDVNVQGNEVCFDVKFEDITTANRGHIHSGAAGVNGPIVVPFFDLQLPENQRDPRLETLEDDERLEGCVAPSPTAPANVLADIVAHPENYYVNLHNSRFPGGAIRCQLED